MFDPVSDLIKKLTEKKLTLSLAESCTGGLISSSLTETAGASEFFLGCAVTYSNRSKEKFLNVLNGTLTVNGAVSAETAKEMAAGAKTLFDSDIAASVTGIAGPGGGTPIKPVGTVFIAVTDGKRTECMHLTLSGSRKEIREAAAGNLIRMITEFIG